MKQRKKIVWAVLMMALAAAGYGFYLYNKKPADTRKSTASYSLTAVDLVAAFNSDETAAGKKYVDKVIAVKGKITDIKLDTATGQATVTLDSGDPMAAVTCSFYSDEMASVTKLKPGTTLTVKGVCTGKLMDVVLNKCSIDE